MANWWLCLTNAKSAAIDVQPGSAGVQNCAGETDGIYELF
jgi:hypothetical protein